MSACAHCGGPIPPGRGSTRPARYCSDRCRRDAYEARHAGICAVCGGRLVQTRADRHAACVKVWTRERCLDALRDFGDRYGRAPTAAELGTGHYRGERVEWLPWGATLATEFGSVRAAMRAAGLAPNPTGHWVLDPRPGDRVR